MTLISLTVFLCWWMNPRDNLIKVEIVVENIIPMIWFDRNMMETIFHSAMSALPFLYKIWFEKKVFASFEKSFKIVQTHVDVCISFQRSRNYIHTGKSRMIDKLQIALGEFAWLLYSQNVVIQYLGTSRIVNFFSYQTSLCIFPSCLSLFSFLCLNLKRDHDVLI